MHYINALSRGFLALVILSFCVASCDLPVQPKFEFEPELGELVTFEDMTVLEWMRSDGSVSSNSANNFDSLVKAIEITGMEAEYNTPGDNRTFLMLNNAAFRDNNEILSVLGVGTLDTLDANGIERLRKILSYHIVDAYVDQGEQGLPVLLTNYTYQTLIPGEEGEIIFHRDERFRMFINKEPLVNALATGLPGNARRSSVRNHNYIFSNGVGHHIRDYARYRPF